MWNFLLQGKSLGVSVFNYYFLGTRCLKNERRSLDFDEVVGVKCDVWEIDRSRSGS